MLRALSTTAPNRINATKTANCQPPSRSNSTDGVTR